MFGHVLTLLTCQTLITWTCVTTTQVNGMRRFAHRFRILRLSAPVVCGFLATKAQHGGCASRSEISKLAQQLHQLCRHEAQRQLRPQAIRKAGDEHLLVEAILAYQLTPTLLFSQKTHVSWAHCMWLCPRGTRRSQWIRWCVWPRNPLPRPEPDETLLQYHQRCRKTKTRPALTLVLWGVAITALVTAVTLLCAFGGGCASSLRGQPRPQR